MSIYLDIHNEAMKAADMAATKFFEDHGEPMYCGFAWIIVGNCTTQPNKDFVKALSKISDGHPSSMIAEKNDSGKGYRISAPAYHLPSCGWRYRQSMDIKEAACQAYANVLRMHNIDGSMHSRAD